MQRTLSMRYSRDRQRETVAWLVPGTDVETWLDELSHWSVLLSHVTCRVISSSERDAQLTGVLVTVASAPQPHVSRRCQEYGRIGSRFYLPANAVLEPFALDTEIAELLSADQDEYVFHPSAGLIRFEPTDLLSVADLIQLPDVSDTDWNWAQPGLAICDRLRSVTPDQTPSVEEFLRDAGGDIASLDPAEARGSDPEPDENVGFLRGAFHKLKQALGAEKSPTRPFDRLLKLLDKDPDEALRYAVPLEGQGAHRGTASPSGGLIRRIVDFSLKHLGGGQPGSAWFVPNDTYQQLQNHYRKLAQREIDLGRHRRAAYIYAHLLNDLHQAASVLAAGGHFREAAVLYRDRLDQAYQAAKCFEQGGLWSEAIDLYQKLQRFETVGELYRAIGQDDDAARAYRQAVDQRLKDNDLLGAARLLEQQLDSSDEAFAVLGQGWPDHKQAEQCLNEKFRFLKGQSAHDESEQLIREITDHSLSDNAAAKAARVLAHQASQYPDGEVRDLAADTVRMIASEKLKHASQPFATELLREVKRLVPNDLLLQRDCNRYPTTLAETRSTADGHTRISDRHFAILRNVVLREDVNWMTAASNQRFCFLAGCGDGALVVARLNWTDFDQQPDYIQWPVSHAFCDSPILLCPDGAENSETLVHIQGSPAVVTKRFPVSDAAPGEQRAGGHIAFSRQTLALARSPDGLTWIAEEGDREILLRSYDREQHLINSQAIPLPPGATHSDLRNLRSVPIAVTRSHLYLGLQQYLFCITRGVGGEVLRTNSDILNIQVPPEDFPRYAILTCHHEVSAVWHRRHENRIETLSDRVLDPVVGITRNGVVVIAEEKQFTIFERHSSGFARRSAGVHSSPTPLAIVTAKHPNQMVDCGKSGQLHLLEVIRG